MLTIRKRKIILNEKISSRSKEDQERFHEESLAMLNDPQYCIFYNVNYLDLSDEQVIPAEERLYEGMFEGRIL